jgi:hypothetical protein
VHSKFSCAQLHFRAYKSQATWRGWQSLPLQGPSHCELVQIHAVHSHTTNLSCKKNQDESHSSSTNKISSNEATYSASMNIWRDVWTKYSGKTHFTTHRDMGCFNLNATFHTFQSWGNSYWRRQHIHILTLLLQSSISPYQKLFPSQGKFPIHPFKESGKSQEVSSHTHHGTPCSLVQMKSWLARKISRYKDRASRLCVVKPVLACWGFPRATWRSTNSSSVSGPLWTPLLSTICLCVVKPALACWGFPCRTWRSTNSSSVSGPLWTPLLSTTCLCVVKPALACWGFPCPTWRSTNSSSASGPLWTSLLSTTPLHHHRHI